MKYIVLLLTLVFAPMAVAQAPYTQTATFGTHQTAYTGCGTISYPNLTAAQKGAIVFAGSFYPQSPAGSYFSTDGMLDNKGRALWPRIVSGSGCPTHTPYVEVRINLYRVCDCCPCLPDAEGVPGEKQLVATLSANYMKLTDLADVTEKWMDTASKDNLCTFGTLGQQIEQIMEDIEENQIAIKDNGCYTYGGFVELMLPQMQLGPFSTNPNQLPDPVVTAGAVVFTSPPPCDIFSPGGFGELSWDVIEVEVSAPFLDVGGALFGQNGAYRDRLVHENDFSSLSDWSNPNFQSDCPFDICSDSPNPDPVDFPMPWIVGDQMRPIWVDEGETPFQGGGSVPSPVTFSDDPCGCDECTNGIGPGCFPQQFMDLVGDTADLFVLCTKTAVTFPVQCAGAVWDEISTRVDPQYLHDLLLPGLCVDSHKACPDYVQLAPMNVYQNPNGLQSPCLVNEIDPFEAAFLEMHAQGFNCWSGCLVDAHQVNECEIWDIPCD